MICEGVSAKQDGEGRNAQLIDHVKEPRAICARVSMVRQNRCEANLEARVKVAEQLRSDLNNTLNIGHVTSAR